MATLDVGGLPMVSQSAPDSGAFGGAGGIGLIGLLFLLQQQQVSLAEFGRLSTATAEQTNSLSTYIGNATGLTNKYIADNQVTTLQGLQGLSSQLCESGRATDASIVAGNGALLNAINCNAKENLLATLQGDSGIQSSICQSSAANAMGFKQVELQNAEQFCTLKTAVLQDGQRTRDLIQGDKIEALQFKIASLESQLNDNNRHHEVINISNTNNNLNAQLVAAIGSITATLNGLPTTLASVVNGAAAQAANQAVNAFKAASAAVAPAVVR